MKQFDKIRHTYNEEKTAKLLRAFFEGFPDVTKQVTADLTQIKDHLAKSSLFQHRTPFHASIMIIFDTEQPQNCNVKLIDFGRCYPKSEVKDYVSEEQERTVLKGIENLIGYISSRGQSVNFIN